MRARQAVLSVVLLTVLASIPTALAYHNSVGFGETSIVFPNENGPNGALAPDVPDSMRPLYHTNLVPPRVAPHDQVGSRYTVNCNPNAVGELNPCYVGYLDMQLEYFIIIDLFLIDQPDDPLYPVNPEAGDPDCPRVQDDPAEYPSNIQSPNCQGEGMHWYWPQGDLYVDVNLLEAPQEQIAAAQGVETGSGSVTYPGLIEPYLYFFGRHAPGNPAPSPLKAGTAPFTEVPANACQPRTGTQCSMLQPYDVKARDANHPDGTPPPADGPAFSRVCAFTPQFNFNTARWQGLCGSRGFPFDTFLGVEGAGGFGTGINTWIELKPGYYTGTLIDTNICDPADTGQGSATCQIDDGSAPGTGLAWYVAINPRVPGQGSTLQCIQPNFLGPAGNEVYGAYVADAIDTDLYRNAFSPQADVVNTAVEDVGAQALIDSVIELAQRTVEGLIEDLPPLPPEVEGAIAAAQEIADEATDRADLLESADLEPDQPGDSTGTVSSPQFSVSVPATGLACNPSNQLVGGTAHTYPGILRFNAGISGATMLVPGVVFFNDDGTFLKDPSLTDGGLPVRESDTTRGYWQAYAYSVSGQIVGIYDSSGGDGDPNTPDDDDGSVFDGCAPVTGVPDVDQDQCPWRALWDAYNPRAVDSGGQTTGQFLDSKGYDRSKGVGLYAVLKVTGPVAVISADPGDATVPIEDRTAVLGTGNVLGQNCVVATSFGFAPKLATLKGKADNNGLLDLLCGNHDAARSVVIDDAFFDAAPDGPGGFTAAFDWVKLLPTPSGLQGTTGGATDALCVYGVWSIDPNTVAGDTIGNPSITGDDLELTGDADGTTYEFHDCDRATSVLAA